MLTAKEIKNNVARSRLTMAWWLQLTVIVVLAMLLTASNWGTIREATSEAGDFAANSLLIQDAKSLHLFVGNYSRVGFNHPGPAILYVLTAGEVVFHDVLHVVKSPISGQLIAVAIYSACWLFAIFHLLARLTGSRANGALATAVFAYVAAWGEYQFFTGMWFPHLYFFPFATMLLAAARMGGRHTDGWLALAVSTGFVINGHVSFVATAGIIYLAVVARSHLQARSDAAAPGLLSRAFLAAHRRPLLYFVGALALFLVPLLIDTALRFPGPISDYVRFSGGHKANSVRDALSYTSQYWGGVLPMMTGMALLAVLSVCVKLSGRAFANNAGSLVAVLFAATFAMWFYARYGVDMLDQKYIGAFYAAVPALTVGLAAAYFYRQLELARKPVLLWLVVLSCTVATYQKIAKPAEYAPIYNHPELADLYRALSAVEHHGRLVLDLRNGNNWGEVWSNVLGVMAYAKRRGDDFICVNDNWHISFTRVNRCTPAEVAEGKHLIVDVSSADGRTDEVPLLRGATLSFFNRVTPAPAGKGYIGVARRPTWFSFDFLKSGWSPVESEFVWSEQTQAHLSIPVPVGFSGTLMLDVGAYLPQPASLQNVAVTINGVPQAGLQFNAAQNRRQAQFKIPPVQGTSLEVALKIDKPISPADFGSADKRQLGVSLYGIQVDPN